MNSVVYVVENYETGDMYGFQDKEKALKFIIQRYIEDDFGGIKNAIMEECCQGDDIDLDEIDGMLDYIRNDLTQVLTTDSIDGFMTMKEVFIEE